MTNTNTPAADAQPEIERDDRHEVVRLDGGGSTRTDDSGGGQDDRPTILVPLEVLEGESLPDGTSELLANAHVVLLGYHVLPEQTATEQAREQFGATARKKLREFADRLTTAGATTDIRLVFTHDEQTTINRIIYEHDCLAVLVPNSVETPESVLVAIRGRVGISRNTRLVAGLFAGTDVDVTLYHIIGADELEDDAETLMNGVQNELVERGMAPDAIDVRIENPTEQSAIDAITALGETHDAVVMGETDPSVTTFVFGMPSEQIAERFLGPVLVVQRERPDETA